MKPLYTEQEFYTAKSKEKLPCQCYNCQSTFYVYKSNIKHELSHNRGRVKFCSKACNDKYASKVQNVICANCNKITLKKNSEIKEGKNNFCSMSCAGIFNGKKRVHSSDIKEKISNGLKKFYLNTEKPIKQKTQKMINVKQKRICINCDKETTNKRFCSRSCTTTWSNINLGTGRKAGLASVVAQSKNRRSKNEIYFEELCRQKFKEVKFNEPIFNGWDADVIIEDLKLAILWNGKWHYEKITKKHSVEQVQNRDRIKMQEISNLGYQSYIIKDMGKYKKEFVEKKFEEMLVFLKLL